MRGGLTRRCFNKDIKKKRAGIGWSLSAPLDPLFWILYLRVSFSIKVDQELVPLDVYFHLDS